jgi:hypothetical protein
MNTDIKNEIIYRIMQKGHTREQAIAALNAFLADAAKGEAVYDAIKKKMMTTPTLYLNNRHGPSGIHADDLAMAEFASKALGRLVDANPDRKPANVTPRLQRALWDAYHTGNEEIAQRAASLDGVWP